MAGKKRSVKETRTPKDEELFIQIKNMDEPYRSYACFIYLIGARCREPLGISYKVIEKDGSKNTYWTRQPILTKDIYIKEGYLWADNISVFKRKDKPLLNKYCPYNKYEKAYTDILLEYLKGIPGNEAPWKFSRSMAWKTINKATGLFPHKLRGLRASRDVSHYGLGVTELQVKFGWKEAKTPLEYVTTSDSEIRRKINRSTALLEQEEKERENSNSNSA